MQWVSAPPTLLPPIYPTYMQSFNWDISWRKKPLTGTQSSNQSASHPVNSIWHPRDSAALRNNLCSFNYATECHSNTAIIHLLSNVLSHHFAKDYCTATTFIKWTSAKDSVCQSLKWSEKMHFQFLPENAQWQATLMHSRWHTVPYSGNSHKLLG